MSYGSNGADGEQKDRYKKIVRCVTILDTCLLVIGHMLFALCKPFHQKQNKVNIISNDVILTSIHIFSVMVVYK